jgi:ABC-2 type transport system ATP-binding protein
MIEVCGLTKRYGRTLAVDDLSFTIRPGLVTGFLGPNGAGKTTTMRSDNRRVIAALRYLES